MALRKIVSLALGPITSLMSQTSQLTSETFHLSPPSSFSSPPPLVGEMQNLVSALAEMFQLFDVKFQNRCDQMMQQQQDLLQVQLQDSLLKQEDFCLNAIIAPQDLAEQVDTVAVDESYSYPEGAILESYIDFSKMNKIVEQGIIEERLCNPEQAFIYQDIQLEESEQSNCEFILGVNEETIKQTNFIQSYLDNFEDQQLIVIDSFQLLKTTKTDIQINTQMILAERGENFVQFEVIKFCDQFLRFVNQNALICELTWYRKKARVRYKHDIKCYLMG